MPANISKDKIWFLGRGFEEYLLMFDLHLENLKNCRILDCNAGASSFTLQMHQRGYDATAVDLMYDFDPNEIDQITAHDFKTLMGAHHGLEDKVEWGFFKNQEEMMDYRIKCYQKFAKDYQKSWKERYIKAELPYLNFPDNSFHLVLSSHLLFLYDDRLDYQFHADSIKEMLRVSIQEIRIYPLISLNQHGKRSKYLDHIIEEFGGDYLLDIQKVNYRFRKGADEMLRIMKKSLNGTTCSLLTYDAVEVEGK